MIENNMIKYRQKFEKYKIARKKYLENHTHVRGYFRSYIWHAFLLRNIIYVFVLGEISDD